MKTFGNIRIMFVLAGVIFTISSLACASGKVTINGTELTELQIADFKNLYGAEPQPGNYWYDQMSGLYGVVGHPAHGFILAGHDYGALDRNASKGDTEVFVNGRNLPKAEYVLWCQILGYWIQPGSYWFDRDGNVGIEGLPIPLANLYVAAQQNGFTGNSGGGDNLWSTRFSAGNYDSNNERGYVSVPGYGPIGYGF
jgi:hypothetical protein